MYKNRLPYFVTFNISLVLSIAEFALEYLVPKKQSAFDALGDQDECPMEYADIFAILTFSWMTPMMKYGYKHFLTQDDLWNLRRRDSTKVTGTQLQRTWDTELEKKRPSLWIALFRAFGGPYFRGACIKTISDSLAFVQPQLLRLLITFVDSYRRGNEPQPAIRGVVIALAMFATSVRFSSPNHFCNFPYRTGISMSIGATSINFRSTKSAPIVTIDFRTSFWKERR